jgi:hypothetical protein
MPPQVVSEERQQQAGFALEPEGGSAEILLQAVSEGSALAQTGSVPNKNGDLAADVSKVGPNDTTFENGEYFKGETTVNRGTDSELQEKSFPSATYIDEGSSLAGEVAATAAAVRSTNHSRADSSETDSAVARILVGNICSDGLLHNLDDGSNSAHSIITASSHRGRVDTRNSLAPSGSSSGYSNHARALVGNIMDDGLSNVTNTDAHDADSVEVLSSWASERFFGAREATGTHCSCGKWLSVEVRFCWNCGRPRREDPLKVKKRIQGEASRVAASTKIQARVRGQMARARVAMKFGWRSALYDRKKANVADFCTASQEETLLPDASLSLDTALGDSLDTALCEFSLSRDAGLLEDEEDGDGSLACILANNVSAEPPKNSLAAILQERLTDPPELQKQRLSLQKQKPISTNKRHSTKEIAVWRPSEPAVVESLQVDTSEIREPETSSPTLRRGGFCLPRKEEGVSAFSAIRSGDLDRLRSLRRAGKLLPSHVDSYSVVNEQGKTLLQVARETANAEILRFCFHTLHDRNAKNLEMDGESNFLDPEALGNFVPPKPKNEKFRLEYATLPLVLGRGFICNYTCEILEDGVRKRLDDSATRSHLFGLNGSHVVFSVRPELPRGLDLDASTGSIRGTPTFVTGASVYTVTASISVPSSIQKISSDTPSSISAKVSLAVQEAPVGLCYPYLERILEDATPSIGLNEEDWVDQCEAIVEKQKKPTGRNKTPRMLPSLRRITLPGRVKAPSSFAFALDAVPTLQEGVSEVFDIEPSLPAGMVLDPVTGLIDGFPLDVPTGYSSSHVVSAKNAVGVATCVLHLMVERGEFGLVWLKLDSTSIVNALVDATIPRNPLLTPLGSGSPRSPFGRGVVSCQNMTTNSMVKPNFSGRNNWDYWRITHPTLGMHRPDLDWEHVIARCAAMLSLYGNSVTLNGALDAKDCKRAAKALRTSVLLQMLSLGRTATSYQEFLTVISNTNHSKLSHGRLAVCSEGGFELDGTRIQEPIVYLHDGTTQAQRPALLGRRAEDQPHMLPLLNTPHFSTVERIRKNILDWNMEGECDSPTIRARKAMMFSTGAAYVDLRET